VTQHFYGRALSGNHYQIYQAEKDICGGKIKSFLSNENASHDTSNANYKAEKQVLDICLQLRSALADKMAAFYAGENHSHIIIGSFFMFLTTVAAGLATWWARCAVKEGEKAAQAARDQVEDIRSMSRADISITKIKVGREQNPENSISVQKDIIHDGVCEFKIQNTGQVNATGVSVSIEIEFHAPNLTNIAKAGTEDMPVEFKSIANFVPRDGSFYFKFSFSANEPISQEVRGIFVVCKTTFYWCDMFSGKDGEARNQTFKGPLSDVVLCEIE